MINGPRPLLLSGSTGYHEWIHGGPLPDPIPIFTQSDFSAFQSFSKLEVAFNARARSELGQSCGHTPNLVEGTSSTPCKDQTSRQTRAFLVSWFGIVGHEPSLFSCHFFSQRRSGPISQIIPGSPTSRYGRPFTKELPGQCDPTRCFVTEYPPTQANTCTRNAHRYIGNQKPPPPPPRQKKIPALTLCQLDAVLDQG